MAPLALGAAAVLWSLPRDLRQRGRALARARALAMVAEEAPGARVGARSAPSKTLADARSAPSKRLFRAPARALAMVATEAPATDARSTTSKRGALAGVAKRALAGGDKGSQNGSDWNRYVNGKVTPTGGASKRPSPRRKPLRKRKPLFRDISRKRFPKEAMQMDPWMWRLMSMKIRADEWFDIVDLNGDGIISFAELRQHLEAQKFDESKIYHIFGLLDLNGDGDISKSEIRECFVKYDNPVLREALGLGASEADALFDAIDTNGDGAISRLELSKFLQISDGSVQNSHVAHVFRMFDADGNGMISREEIRAAYAADTEFRRVLGLR